MAIKANINNAEKEIEQIKNSDEQDIDYVYSRIGDTEVEGELPISIKSIGGNLTDYRIYGQTSRNLFDGEILQGFYSSSNGIYYGSFGSYQQYVCTNKIECKSNTTYTIQVYAPEIISYSYGFIWWDENLNFISSYFSTESQSTDITTFTATAPNNAKYMAFDLGANSAESTIVPSNVSWIMLNSGSTPLPYEPYGESVGDRTANLFDGEFLQGFWAYANGMRNSTSVTWITTSKLPCKPNTDYSFKSSYIGRYFGFVWFDSNGEYISSSYVSDTSSNMYVKFSSLSPVDAAYLIINIKSQYNTSTGDSFTITPSDVTDLMLNEGSTALPYEPYGYKVPVTVEGKNLFDENSLISPISGFSWYFNDEHYLLATNKSSDNRPWGYNYSQLHITLSPGTYTVQLSGVGSSSQYSEIRVFESNNNIIYSENIAGKTNIVITFTLNTHETIGIEIKLYDGKYRFMLNEGTTPLPYEPYHAPITTPIYLPEQIRKVGTEAEYIDYGEQKFVKKFYKITLNFDDMNNDETFPGWSGGTAVVEYCNKIRSLAINTPDGYMPIQRSSISNFKAMFAVNRSILFLGAASSIGHTQSELKKIYAGRSITFILKIPDTDLDVTLPALPTVTGTNVLSVGTEIQPSNMYIKDNFDYKKVFTATRTIEGESPLNYRSIEDSDSTLSNYCIYGQTVDGESVGDRTGNLFDIKTFAETCFKYSATVNYTNNTLTFTATGTDAYVNGALSTGVVVPQHYRSSCIDVLPSTTYTISMSSAPKCYISWVDSSFNVVSNYTTMPTNATSYTFTTPENCTKLLIRLGKVVTNIGDTFTISDIMLNSGSTPLPYEPYGYKVPMTVEGINILPMSTTPISMEVDDFYCEYDGAGTITLTTDKDNAVLGGFSIPLSEEFIIPISVGQGGDGCVQFNNSIANSVNTDTDHINVNFWYNTSLIDKWSLTTINRINSTYSAMARKTINRVSIDINGTGFSTNQKIVIRPAFVLNTTVQVPFEPYHAPVTTPIYLPEQIRKVGDEAEYIDYGEQKQYIETTDGQGKYVVGLNVDFENKTFTRLADAVGLSKGTDFDNFSAFGGRRRCNVADNGTITAYYGDANYTEDGSNGQVMVYQPAFYYKVEPLKTEAQESGVGYHLRNVNYYISNYQGKGYKLHPAFYNEAGDRIDYILLGAYEGCIYDTSANAYITDDSQVLNTSNDKFSSIANVKPASGLSQSLTRQNLEAICKNRGSGWHSLDVRIASMEQLLMTIEFGTMNTQTGAESNGIISITDNSSYNCASLTGSTGSLGNTSGQAISTISDINGVQTVETANGKTAYSFRGDENPWGNIWKFVHGVNIWGDGTMHGGVPYICKDYNFSEFKRTDNYESAGFSVPNENGFINALGYSENFDWLMIPSEIGGDNLLPIGDYTYVSTNLSGYRVTLHGGTWGIGMHAGDFCWQMATDAWNRGRSISGRLVYIPQIEKQHIYTTDLDVTLPALPTLPGTNVLTVGTEI